MNSLKISGKIWLSISFIVVGYMLSMILSVYSGRQNEAQLNQTSNAIFPATQQSQSALSAFETQTKLYEDAFVFGEAGYINQASREAEDALNALNRIITLRQLPQEERNEARKIKLSLKTFTEIATSTYQPLVLNSVLTENEQKLLGKLDSQKNEILAALDKLSRRYSEDLKTSLKTVIDSTKRRAELLVLVFVIAMFSSIILVQFSIRKMITKPLARTVEMLDELRKGKLGRRLRIETTDEIGQMARAMDEFADNLLKKVRLAENIAGGDLTVKVELASGYDTLGEAMNTMVYNLKANQAAIENNVQSLEMQAIALRNTNESLTDEIQERKMAQAKLAETQRQLVDASRQAGMAEVATGVLHNVGNVLNSVNVSATLLQEKVRKLQFMGIKKVSELLEQNGKQLGEFFTHDDRAQKLPQYLSVLSGTLEQERELMSTEILRLTKNINHIKDIISLQQSFAKVSGPSEPVAIDELVEDAVNINESVLQKNEIGISFELSKITEVLMDRQKVLQILVNLVKNAADSLAESGIDEKAITIKNRVRGSNRLVIDIGDNGVGISAENLTRIFAHGFTTKKSGHGFGLHTGALAAKEMGGNLSASSEGLGHGAVFSLEIPVKWAIKQ